MRRLYRDYLELTGLHNRQVLTMVLDALLVGALGTALVTLLAETVKRDVQGQSSSAMMVGFVVALVAYLWLQRGSARRIVRASENASERLRLRILDAFLNAPLQNIELTPEHIKRLLLTRDVIQVTGALSVWVAMIVSATTALCSLVYLAWLSMRAALVVWTVIIVAVVVYQLLIRKTFAHMREAYQLANSGLGFADDIMLGAKELKLDPNYSRYFWQNDLQATLKQATSAAIGFKSVQHDIGLVGTVAFYGLAGMAAFGFARMLQLDQAVVGSIVLVMMFLQAHIQGMVQHMPALTEARQAQLRIEHVIHALEPISEVKTIASEISPLDPDWQALRLKSVSFSYSPDGDSEGFCLNDVDLEIQRGSTVFIVGGNGSGKTTLAKLLLGLYRPQRGCVLLDDMPLNDDQVLSYRSRFCAVFSDVHLFRRDPQHDPGFVDGQLQKTLSELALPLQLNADGRLDVRALSQGQKKRMASAFAMIGQRPICLFDEWTADQDPEFRHYFYEYFLPRLRREGRTVIVITHDDRHFHRADQLVRLDAGRVLEVRQQAQAFSAGIGDITDKGIIK
ncbi:MAG: cyclic peptide export ABC transporter [Ketobacter sp.]|nr:cyclic peptide export ABC transporter [Ketobacter sp.]